MALLARPHVLLVRAARLAMLRRFMTCAAIFVALLADLHVLLMGAALCSIVLCGRAVRSLMALFASLRMLLVGAA